MSIIMYSLVFTVLFKSKIYILNVNAKGKEL